MPETDEQRAKRLKSAGCTLKEVAKRMGVSLNKASYLVYFKPRKRKAKRLARMYHNTESKRAQFNQDVALELSRAGMRLLQ